LGKNLTGRVMAENDSSWAACRPALAGAWF
jgi:hypothetical protein